MISRNAFRLNIVGRLLVLTAAPLTAQDQPDFSGRWVLASELQSDLESPHALSVNQLLVRTNGRGEPMMPFFKEITVVRELKDSTRSETLQIGVEGGEIGGLPGRGIVSRARFAVRWEGRALVLERGTYSGPSPETGEWSEWRDVWSLDLEGRLRVSTTRRSSVDEARTTTLVYRRQ
jgi:hypothetical protein